MASRIHIDKMMGGRVRDKDATVEVGGDGGELINQLIQNLYDELNNNLYQIGDEITQEMIDYFNELFSEIENIFNELSGDIYQELKDYIDNQIQDLRTYVDALTLGDDYTEEIKNYIDSRLTEITNIIGEPVNWDEIKSYIDNLFALFEGNTFNIGDEITQEMIDYFQSIFDNLTVTWEQITNAPNISEEIKNYFDQLYDEFQEFIENINLGDTITEEIKNYIDNSFDELKTFLENFVENFITELIEENLTEIVEEILNNYNAISHQSRLISGSVIWVQNLDFQLSALEYEILGQRRTSSPALVTIPANAGNDPVFAVIYADIFGNTGYILGTAAPAPAVPIVDSNTQLHLTTVYIPALATEPGTDPGGETETPENVVIYDENTEWQTAKTEPQGIAVNLENYVNPYNGEKHISLVTADDSLTWERGELTISELQTFRISRTFEAAVENSTITVTESMLKSMTMDAYMKTGIKNGVRTIGWAKAVNYENVFLKLTSKITGEVFRFSLSPVQNIDQVAHWDIAEIGFSAIVPLNYVFSVDYLAAGDYYQEIEGLTRFQQLYNPIGTGVTITGHAQIFFTNNETVNAKDGTLILSISSSKGWFSSTGLMFQLFNGAAKVGEVAMLPGSLFGYIPGSPGYQRISIPVKAFNPSGYDVDKLVIQTLGSWPGGLTLNLDLIVLQTGVVIPPDETEDRYVENATLDNNALLTLVRTGALPALTVQFGKVAKTNSYNDLDDKPTIPGIPGNIEKDWIEFTFADFTAGTGKTYTLNLKALVAYTINSAVFRVDSGTLTVAVKKNGAAVTGLSAIAADTNITETAATGNNTVAPGDLIELEITATYTGEPTSIDGQINLTRS